jgi:hypothetical protein
MSEKPKKDKHKYSYGGRYEAVADVRRWSFAATECYLRGCACEGCYYDGIFRKSREEYTYLNGKYNCKMKATVLKLVRTFGPPDLNAFYAQGIKQEESENEYDDM